jgi:hypothetical protein
MSASSPSKPVVFATSGLGGMFGWILVHPANTCAGAYVDMTVFSRVRIRLLGRFTLSLFHSAIMSLSSDELGEYAGE